MKKIKRHNKFHVYIIKCQDGTYYTGYTNDLETFSLKGIICIKYPSTLLSFFQKARTARNAKRHPPLAEDFCLSGSRCFDEYFDFSTKNSLTYRLN